MPIKDVLLPLIGEPSAAAIAAIDKCVAAAGDIGARVTALAVEENISVQPEVMSAEPKDAATIEAVQSVSDARGLLQAFDAAANRYGVRNEQQLDRMAAADMPAHFARVCATKGSFDRSGQAARRPIGKNHRAADIRVGQADPDVSGEIRQ